MDGNHWVVIANLSAAGNSPSPKNYYFIDSAPASNSFYRVAEYDISGQLVYTPVNRVTCGSKDEFKLWPNPVQNKAWLSANCSADTKAYLQIIDSKGAAVYFKPVELFRGNNIVNVDLQSLPNGNYILELVANSEKRSFKFIKQ
jgi:hypothetical protein